MSGTSAATWKTVSTLEWKKKQKTPAEPKGFGAILGEAADVVVDKRTASGALMPAYHMRMSEIQMQDEAYIHQQMVKPEESKFKRGFQRLISIGKAKADKTVRNLRPGGAASRKVRFDEDPNSSKASAGQQQPGAAGTAAAGLGAVKGSSISKKAAAAPGALKAGLRFSDVPVAATAEITEAGIQAAPAGGSQPSVEARSEHHPAGTASSNSSCNGSKPSVKMQLQQPSSVTVGYSMGGGGSNHTSSSGSRGSSGEGSAASGMMAAYLQQQSMQQPPQTPSFAAGNREPPEGINRTDLADKQLQRLRVTMAPMIPAAAADEQLDSPQGCGYRPLAIPEETFERWSMAGGGSGAASSSRQARMVLDMAHVVAGPAAANSAGTADAHFSARRGINAGSAPAMQPDAGQMGGAQMGHSSSKEGHSPLQLSGSSSSPDLLANAAAATASGAASSSRSSGDATGSKQRRTTDYLLTLSSVEAPLHPTRRSAGRARSPSSNAPGSASSGPPSQHSSSPCRRHSSSSSSSTTAAGSSAVPAASVSNTTRSSSLTDAQQIAQQQQQRSPSPVKGGGGAIGSSAAAAAAGLGAAGRSSRPSSTIRGSRMSQDAGSAGHAQLAPPPGQGSGRGGGSSSSLGTAGAGSKTSSGLLGGHQQRQQQHSSASATPAGMTRKGSSSLLHLPVISKPAASRTSAAASSTATKK